MFYLAQSRLPLGVAIALQFLGPLTVAIVGTRRPIDLVWIVLAAAGVWWLVGSGARASAIDLVGVVFALCAAIAWAAYILCGRVASAAFGGSTAALAASVAAVLVLPFGIAQAGAALLAPALLPMALLVALLSTVIPFSLELYALPACRRAPSPPSPAWSRRSACCPDGFCWASTWRSPRSPASPW